MVGRYELVAVGKNGKGNIITSKNEKKLTLQEADIFTSLFNDKNELSYYLYSKGYITETPEMFVLLYHVNKKCCYLKCLYKEDNEFIKIAKGSKGNNKVDTNNSLFCTLLSFLIKNADNDFVEYAYDHKYINKYIYDKLIEYKYNKSNYIIKAIAKELSKEYLQVRKLYSIMKIYNNVNKSICEETINKNNEQHIINVEDKVLRRKIVGESSNPYIEYLIEKANMGCENAYEELKGMDLEKILSLKM